MQVWNLLYAARWKYKTQNIVKNSPSAHHRTKLLGYIFATKEHTDNRKTLLNSNISPISPHNMVNFSPLTAEIGSVVWGTPANFNGFRVLASLLQLRRSPEANKLCTMFGRFHGPVHYIWQGGRHVWHRPTFLVVFKKPHHSATLARCVVTVTVRRELKTDAVNADRVLSTTKPTPFTVNYLYTYISYSCAPAAFFCNSVTLISTF